jgi:hypothetical protein
LPRKWHSSHPRVFHITKKAAFSGRLVKIS